ncbi:hypothetical protein KHQ81_01565 [Mycoplasmatota bacterium]|nr:hypothetical protein KHQ81_01565 [Mycoplasmatota bacterium]
MKNLRNRDHISEHNISNYLDKYFYTKIKEIGTNIEQIKRVYTKEEQLKGIDVKIIQQSGNIISIDEKVATNYNTKLSKFAFELDSYQFNRLVPGWLVSENNTDYYLLGWIDVIEDLVESGIKIKSDTVINEEDINYLELLLVTKETIIDFLSDNGYDVNYLIELTKDIRHGKRKLDRNRYLYKNEYDNGIRDFHFTMSGTKVENPLMVNIRKEKLIELGNKRLFIVDKNGVKVKKFE